MKRYATAIWNGTGKEGHGVLSTQSGVLQKQKYSYATRFENEPGTNPEELIAAAHAGCYAMKLSFVLSAAGFKPESLEVKATISLENGTITTSQLELNAKVPGISKEKFDQYTLEAKSDCPISKLLNATITLQANLQS